MALSLGSWLVTGTNDIDEIEVSNRVNITVNAGEGKDYIYNYCPRSLINAGAGKDYIVNDSNSIYTTINGDEDDDYITIWKNKLVTVDGGTGNDEISAYDASDVSINGGDGNDYIYGDVYGIPGTFIGGRGDDTIKNCIGVIQYAEGDGNDVWDCKFYNSTTLNITSGKIDSSIINGDDVILNIAAV